MKLNSIVISNFRSIEQLNIELNGKNLQISGQNGAGKSSIFYAYSWALSTDRLDVSPIDNTKALTSVILNFDDVSIRRSFDPAADVKNVYVIDNHQKAESDFKLFLGNLSNGLDFKIFSKLGYFNSLSNNERRNFLLKLSTLDNQIILDKFPHFEDILEDIPNESDIKARIKVLKDYLKGIPREIEGLSFNLPLFDQNVLDNLTKQLDDINQQINHSTDSSKIHADISILQNKLQNIDQQLADKRKQYSNLKSATCPYCEQPLPQHQLLQLADKLRAEGKSLKNDKSILQNNLQILQDKLSSSTDLSLLFDQKSSVQQQINSLLQAHKSHLRIQELNDSQKKYQAELQDLTDKLAIIEDFNFQKSRLISNEINSKFKHVKFKLFDFVKSTGEIKPCCESTLNNVPYQFLSTGEKFKADLDCLNSLQNHFHLQFPVFIDDFESISSNSLIDLPNQLITLNVVDNQKNLNFNVY